MRIIFSTLNGLYLHLLNIRLKTRQHGCSQFVPHIASPWHRWHVRTIPDYYWRQKATAASMACDLLLEGDWITHPQWIYQLSSILALFRAAHWAIEDDTLRTAAPQAFSSLAHLQHFPLSARTAACAVILLSFSPRCLVGREGPELILGANFAVIGPNCAACLHLQFAVIRKPRSHDFTRAYRFPGCLKFWFWFLFLQQFCS